MNLPQELLDEILLYLLSDDKQDKRSLQNYSLVAKSWVNPSRRRLFKTVEIRERNLRSWLDNIPPANEELLQHVRSLFYVISTEWIDSLPGHRIDVLRDYLPSFQKLQHLSLSFMRPPPDISHQVEIFSTFRHTLSRLSLGCCSVTISALVTLVNYFSCLDRLDLSRMSYKTGGEPTIPLPRPLISKLHISDCYGDGLHFLNHLSQLGPVPAGIVFEDRAPALPVILGRILATLGVNVKRLKLPFTYSTHSTGYDKSILLSRCSELQELELPVAHPGNEEVDILTSITSTRIQKITLVHQSSPRSWFYADWGSFDDPLRRLVDQSECKRGLEVDFRFVDVGGIKGHGDGGVVEIVDSLAKFREKGRMRVVLVDLSGSERVIYPSDGVM